ncbi:thiol reductant ABC exporter subunit CydD [Ammoniphilus oxalaticus]|uniref:Thiol reductant ABC exporter subunit CydD n=1 Tax=Ammoniphilus oxalaticus TaxID=66863 RepID=A0A419SNL0_9BACL|nr:thiol reductant ABC exporter subunit CydD [Ammoniphilus oxalaticus]RKD25843.1 thiol reductant ABC exporter subunit CydD [Ammoniphilus oxalaticus]
MSRRKKGLPSYPGSRQVYILLGFITVIEAVAIIAQAIFLARAITFLFEGVGLSIVINDISFFFGAFLLRHLCSLVQRVIIERFAERLGKMLRKNLIRAYFDQGPSFIQVYGTGRLVTLAMEGIDDLKAYIELAIPKMIRTFIVPAFIGIYVFTMDKASAVIVVVAVPIIVIFMILLGLAAQKMADRQYETYRVLSNHFIDSLKGLETLTYLGQSVAHGKKISHVSHEYRKATNQTLRFAFLSSFALNFFTSLAIAFVAVGLGFRLIDGAITLLPALTILILAPEYFLPIRQVGQDFHATLDGQIALAEVEKVIQMENVSQPIDPLQPMEWNETSVLRLENVTAQREETVILKNISFSWQGNGMIGLVGASGAGKSTLLHLLAGFLNPVEGAVVVNEIASTTFKREDWLEQIAYIPQHPYIFPTSLANNIRFYEPSATDEEVEKVIEQIGFASFVKELPNGIHELIGEGGRSLSGGQEQRVAIARALLSKRPIILLDEPTAHLDIETEYELKQEMMALFKNKLIFFATHRMHWMNEMDYLLVLEDGELVETGQPRDLLAKNGTYAKLTSSFNERRGQR